MSSSYIRAVDHAELFSDHSELIARYPFPTRYRTDPATSWKLPLRPTGSPYGEVHTSDRCGKISLFKCSILAKKIHV